MYSKIYLADMVVNSNRHSAADYSYFPARVVLMSGEEVNALFTREQVNVAIDRARFNPDDIPEYIPWWKRWFK